MENWKGNIVLVRYSNYTVLHVFFVYYRPFLIKISIIQIEKVWMVCLGFERGAAGWKAQTKPQSYVQPPAVLSMFEVSYESFWSHENRSKHWSRKTEWGRPTVGWGWGPMSIGSPITVTGVKCDQIGRFFHFGHPFKAGGNIYFTQITCIVRQFVQRCQNHSFF